MFTFIPQILETLKLSYCRTVGVEFTHISDLEQQNWIRNKFEVNRTEQHRSDYREVNRSEQQGSHQFPNTDPHKKSEVNRTEQNRIEDFRPLMCFPRFLM